MTDPRVRLLLLITGTLMGMFTLERLAILLVESERFARVGTGTLAESFLVGLRFDLVIAFMFIAPLALVLPFATARSFSRAWYRHALTGYAATVLGLSAFACIADFLYFQEFDERLDSRVLRYFRDAYVWRTVWSDYPVIRVIVATLTAFSGAFWTVRRFAFARRCDFPNSVGSWRGLA